MAVKGNVLSLNSDDEDFSHSVELTALRALMTAPGASDAPSLVRRALETVAVQTQAQLTGFLSLDPENPLPRLIVPTNSQLDVALSRRLTKMVQRRGRLVWLAESCDSPLSGGSLEGITDALCVPLSGSASPQGALHVYKRKGTFTKRDPLFCEVLAGYLSSKLDELRTLRKLEAENIRLRGARNAEELIGSSQSMNALRALIARVAPWPGTVLIQGESGVGKELVALALHHQGPWHKGPLVVANCAAITATLPEAELFGHCKGAFTGAERDRPGLFQQAEDGTLFLDEIGELPLDCQAKLLRVVEGKGFRPVGATSEMRVAVRIIAATNRDLEREVRNGRFRQDLYFRLQGIQLRVPPLREHLDDIPNLVDHFLRRLGTEFHRPVRLSGAVLSRFQSYSWPGNVRQLWLTLESSAALASGDLLDVSDVFLPPVSADQSAADHQFPSLRLEDLEAWAVRQALIQTRGNITRAAKVLGIVRDTLSTKIKKLGLRESS